MGQGVTVAPLERKSDCRDWVYPVEEFRFCPYGGEPLNRPAWGGWYGHSGDCIGGAGCTGQDGD